MKKTALILTSLLLAGSALHAHAAENFSKAQKEELNAYIKQYLLDNPEIIIQSLESYRMDQEKAAEQAAAEKMDSHMDFLTSKEAPSIGNSNGDVTVVEFFDYNCGYCKRAFPDIKKSVQEDHNVRFVFRDMPILSPTSRIAAQWALAAQKQGKYFEYHTALMEYQGQKDEAALIGMAKQLDLDVEQMKKDAQSKEISDELDKIGKITHEIGIQGTPAFIINGQLERGYLGPGGLERAIEEARKADKKG